MRILFVAAWYPHPPDNGSKARTHHLLKGLVARHHVDLVTFLPPTGEAPDLRAAGLCHTVHVVPRVPFAASRWRGRVGLLSRTPSHIGGYHSAELERLLLDLTASERYDAIVASTVLTASAVRYLPARSRVLEEHNFLGRMMAERHARSTGHIQRWRTWLTWRKDIAWERKLFAAFHLLTMVSEPDREAVSAMGCATTRVEVVPNGVDAAALSLVQPAVPPLLMVYPGSVTYDANREAVAWFAGRVLPLIRRDVPDARLVVTGATGTVALGELEDAGVLFTGHVRDVHSIIAGTRVCVVPLLTGGGTRIKVLEAMAVGTPVVSTAKGVDGLGVNHGVHCLVADDPAIFADSVVHLFREPHLRLSIARAAKALVVTRFNWATLGRRFAALVEEVAGA